MNAAGSYRDSGKTVLPGAKPRHDADDEKDKPRVVPAPGADERDKGACKKRCGDDRTEDGERKCSGTCPSRGDKKCGKPKPSNAGDVPGEAKGLLREDVAAEQLREIGPPEQANEDVALAEVGVGETDAHE